MLGTAETVGDLLGGLQRQMPGRGRVSGSVPVHRGAEEPAATPHGAETLIEVIEAHASSDPERTHILLTDAVPEPTQITSPWGAEASFLDRIEPVMRGTDSTVAVTSRT